jgi:hypothetical protein
MDETAALQWQELFARCERWRRERGEWDRSQGREVASSWPFVAFAPATEAEIAREEARIGARLPPSLRSFYLQSNGYGMVGSAVWTVRSVEQIGWLRDVVPFLYDIVFEDDPAVGRSLVVSGESDAAWWLLDPGDADERGEWPGGRWASWNPGMSWMARDFIGLFEAEVSLAERVLAKEKFPPPPLGTGRNRNEQTVGDVDRPIEPGQGLPRNGYTYVPVEGFTSVVTISAPSVARVGEWIPLNATRRSGPWTHVRWEELRPEEMNMFDPRMFEREVAGNLSWTIDPPADARFNTDFLPGSDPGARSVKFEAPGIYKLQGYSVFPTPTFSNVLTIRVE